MERLLGEAEHPAGHRDGDPVAGEAEDRREPRFPAEIIVLAVRC
jgi:hypothetical protein